MGRGLAPAKKKWLLEQHTKLEGDLRRTMQELNRETDAALADNKRKQVWPPLQRRTNLTGAPAAGPHDPLPSGFGNIACFDGGCQPF